MIRIAVAVVLAMILAAPAVAAGPATTATAPILTAPPTPEDGYDQTIRRWRDRPTCYP